MAQDAGAGWDRRDFIGGVALFALALGIPAAAVSLSDLAEDEAPSARARQLIRQVSQLVLPRTATPGAGEVGVGDFVVLALAHGLEGTRAPVASAGTPAFARFARRDGSLRHLAWLENDLDRRSGGDFLRRSAAEQLDVLSRLDAEAFAPDAGEHPWKAVKALILTGYYTSEVGGSRELRYELVPGRWDADLPLKRGEPAWSSDWTAVDFG